jgi:ankyrin repeat protein
MRAGLCGPEARLPQTQPPKIELLAREADGVDLLRVVAEFTPSDFVAVREGRRARIDIPAHAAPPEELWADIIARSGMQHLARDSIEVVANACRFPVQAEPSDSLSDDGPITVNFNRISTVYFYALVARVRGLKLYAPEGLPAVDLAMLLRARPVSRILATVDSVLALETSIEGTQLVVRKRSGPRRCKAAAVRETWQASLPEPDVLEQSLTQMLSAWSHKMDRPCHRVSDFPETTSEPCSYLEYFPLGTLIVRGYIRLTPRSPYGVLIENSVEPYLSPLYPGDSVGDQAGVVSWTGGREPKTVQIVERWKPEAAKLTEISYRTGGIRVSAVPPGYYEHSKKGPRRYEEPLERYDLEDLLIRSTKEVRGQWQAKVVDPFGLVHMVYINHHLGINFGKIRAIGPAEVHLEEIVPDNLGGYMTRDVVLAPGVRYEEPRKAIKRKYDAPTRSTRVQSEFIEAARRGEHRELERIVALGANMDAVSDAEHGNALVAAIAAGRSDTTAWLLAKGARVNILVGPSEETPLHLAAFQGNCDIVKQLIEAGADVNLRDAHEQSAIERALDEGNGSMVTLLVEHGADLKSWDDIGLTPFTRAAMLGRVGEVRLFLANGVTIADRDRSGYTMLAAAAYGGNQELVSLLLSLGSDVNAHSTYGESVLDLAQLNKADPGIIALLAAHGARSEKTGRRAEDNCDARVNGAVCHAPSGSAEQVPQ